MAPPGPAKVKVEVLMVAGFIALLNVVLIMATPEQTPTSPFAGVTRVTVGGVKFEFPPLLSGSLQPVAAINRRNTANKAL